MTRGNAIFVAVLLVVAIGVRQMLGADQPLVSLDKAEPLTGSVSQSMYTGGGETKLPVAGIDYRLEGTTYFESNNWVVSQILPLKDQFNASFVVMQKRSDIYQVVLGPGSAFPAGYLQNLPSEVGQYLKNQGVIYGSAASR